MSLHSYPAPIVPAETIGQMRKIADAFYAEGATGAAYLPASVVMQLVQATGKPGFYADTPFGVCPSCGDYEEVMKIANKNYGVCHEHRVYWYIGRSYLPLDNIPGDTLDEHPIYSPNVLNSYTKVTTLQAFPKDVCPCCGRYRTHTLWCLYLQEKPQALHVSLTDIAI